MLPELKKFREAAEACHGNYSRIADAFGVTRQTVYNWCKEDPDFKEVVNDCKMRLFDQALDAARALTVGIPKIGVNGQLLGWIERPDGQMVRYILSTLGKNEGFTERKELTGDGQPLFPKVINLITDDLETPQEFKVDEPARNE